jgi:diguanylate cyclase (GGDEF)-like protein
VAQRALTDQLTGLANRRHFDDHFARALAGVDRNGDSVSLIVVDVDFFKRVNDSYGHAAGDAVLKAVAAAIRDSARAVDLCARYGGEELVVVLPKTSLAAACDVAERLRQAVARKVVRMEGREITVTASFGVATYPESAHAHDAVFPAADRALYRAKAEGRNCVRFAPPISSATAT